MNESKEKVRASRRPLPRWKKFLIVGNVLALVVGGGLYAYGYIAGGRGDSSRQVSTDPSKDGPRAADLGVTGSSLVEGGARTFPGAGSQSDALESEGMPSSGSLAPLLTKGALSFLVGFCIAYAVRTFLKISAVFLGGAAILFFALQYFGLIPAMDMSALEDKFQQFAAAAGQQLNNFKSFVEGNLPSSAAATFGIFTGWKKH